MKQGIELTEGEKKIVKALNRLSKLWERHGENLLLFNGRSLRYKGTDHASEIDFFAGIRGDGGDGGDVFE